jgi:aminoglycoside phosphotransferase (APT) family kinase protein
MLGGWQHPGEEPRFASVYFTERSGLPRREELAERYARKTGRSLERLDYYVVLALFKLGCVLEGHYHKVLTGKSDREDHKKMGPLVLRLIRQAEETARKGL